jgi:hypothetical protein
MSDAQFIRDYAENGAEEAFAPSVFIRRLSEFIRLCLLLRHCNFRAFP